jgi:hypothetical protein
MAFCAGHGPRAVSDQIAVALMLELAEVIGELPEAAMKAVHDHVYTAVVDGRSVCVCCLDRLEPPPTAQLCCNCAVTYTEYEDGTAFCDRHQPQEGP